MIAASSPEAFLKDAKEYAGLGKALSDLSRLEFAHDELVVAIHCKHPSWSRKTSKSFPSHYKEKTDFVCQAVAELSGLSSVPVFADGYNDPVWLGLQLDEIYDARRALAHGAIDLVRKSEGKIAQLRSRRWVRGDKSSKGHWRQLEV